MLREPNTWLPSRMLSRSCKNSPKGTLGTTGFSRFFRAGHYKDLTETGNRARKVSGTQGNQRDTRQNNDLTLPQYRLATGQKTITYRGAKLYSNIAKDIRDTGNLNVFKKRIFNIFLVHR